MRAVPGFGLRDKASDSDTRRMTGKASLILLRKVCRQFDSHRLVARIGMLGTT
jgi:hypothetical protein